MVWLAKAKKTVKQAAKKPAPAVKAGQKPAAKSGKKRKAMPRPVAGGLQALEKQAAVLESRIADIRKAIFANQASVKRKMGEKVRLDEELNALLRKAFVEEKGFLAKMKGGAKKEEADLQQQIASLERVNKVYEAKRLKMLEAKKRQFALKKQLQDLEKQAEVLGPYA